MSGLNNGALRVPKTVKLFIGGDFPRTESGRSFPVYSHADRQAVYAHLCQASRKDFRNAVTAAQGALHGWENRAAYNRGQILYRMAEMAESKRGEFIEVLHATRGLTEAAASDQVDQAIDAFVFYSGFADKYQQILGAVNPVTGPHHNFTTPDSVGVVGLLCDEKLTLGEVAASIAAIIVGGNTCVALLPESMGALLAPLAEVFATSDLPKGVVNLLSGHVNELAKQYAMHMEVNSLSVQISDEALLGELKEIGIENMKRIVGPMKQPLSLEHIMAFIEFKTVWHPVGY